MTETTTPTFSIAAFKNTTHYGQPVYAVLRDGKLIGELLYDGGRWKNAGGPAWMVRVFQANGCHAVMYGNRTDKMSALQRVKDPDNYYVRTAVEDRYDLALKLSSVYRDGVLLNG